MSMIATVEPRERRSAPDDRRVAGVEQLRLLVVAGDPAVRRNLRKLLDDEQDFTVLASASSAEAGLLAARRMVHDVAVVDYKLDDRSGLWLSRELKRLEKPPLVVLCADYPDSLLATAMPAAKADAVLDKADLVSGLCDVVRGTAAGVTEAPALPWQL